jgi:hypothetical protein
VQLSRGEPDTYLAVVLARRRRLVPIAEVTRLASEGA